MTGIIVDRGASADNRVRSVKSRIVVDRGARAWGHSGSKTLKRDAGLAVMAIEGYVHWSGKTVSGSDEGSRITIIGQGLMQHTLKEALVQLSSRDAVLKVRIMQCHSFELTNEGGREGTWTACCLIVASRRDDLSSTTLLQSGATSEVRRPC
jgi:hypothetical protein